GSSNVLLASYYRLEPPYNAYVKPNKTCHITNLPVPRTPDCFSCMAGKGAPYRVDSPLNGMFTKDVNFWVAEFQAGGNGFRGNVRRAWAREGEHWHEARHPVEW